MYRKLNFGCGTRYASGWDNLDFHSIDPSVRQANLLAGFPYGDALFDAVYSSHVLEHFDPDQAAFLVRESYRVLKTGGIIRIVVPDMESACREYLRILALRDDNSDKNRYYEWIMVELLDQLVRNVSGGQMGPLMQNTHLSDNEHMKRYVCSRTENVVPNPHTSKVLWDKLKSVNLHKMKTRLTYFYLRSVSKLIPASLRSMVFVSTGIGERHRWMYDSYGLKCLVESHGFSNVRICTYSESAIIGFNKDHLDSLPDGRSYKNNSVYLEAEKV